MLVSTSAQIFSAPNNDSTAKAQYSFPKAPRFPKVEPASSNFYTIPPALSKRSTSFGYGKKYDFTQGKDPTPDPGKYSVLADATKGNIAYTFGISRNAAKAYVPGHFIADPAVPGPGTYSFAPKFGKEGRAISMGVKKSNVGKSKSTLSVPGPGAYDVKFSNSSGTYVLSSHQSLRSHKFAPSTLPRFEKQAVNITPAPGSYNVEKGFLKNFTSLSNFKSASVTTFPTSPRNFFNDKTETPGPGTYRYASDFGYYDGGNPGQTKSLQQ